MAEDIGAFPKVQRENIQKASASADFLFVCVFVFSEASSYSGRCSRSTYPDNPMFDFIAECLKSKRDSVLCTCGHLKCKMYAGNEFTYCFMCSFVLFHLPFAVIGKSLISFVMVAGCMDIKAVRGMSSASSLPEHIL